MQRASAVTSDCQQTAHTTKIIFSLTHPLCCLSLLFWFQSTSQEADLGNVPGTQNSNIHSLKHSFLIAHHNFSWQLLGPSFAEDDFICQQLVLVSEWPLLVHREHPTQLQSFTGSCLNSFCYSHQTSATQVAAALRIRPRYQSRLATFPTLSPWTPSVGYSPASLCNHVVRISSQWHYLHKPTPRMTHFFLPDIW